VLFLERDMPWYASNRDLKEPFAGRVELYDSIDDLKKRFTKTIERADLVIIGSFVPDGVQVCEWITENASGIKAFYDIDTPVTIANLKRGSCDYLIPRLIPEFDLYLSFAGGPVMDQLERVFGAVLVRPLYCSVDIENYFPQEMKIEYDLGYMGTFSADRQDALDHLMLEPAAKMAGSKFIVAGPLYPKTKIWPHNVMHIDHIAPLDHRKFYCSQRFTLNITRADMVQSGYAPSVRLFEASACGVPIISDYWEGLNDLFRSGEEILVSESSDKTIDFLKNKVTVKDQKSENVPGKKCSLVILLSIEPRSLSYTGMKQSRIGQFIHVLGNFLRQ
jgi:spore maturation protein CgeB